MSNELFESFNKLKNLIYPNNYEKYKLTDIAYIIKKENKTPQELETYNKIYQYIKTMNTAIQTLGTKLISIDNMDTNFGDIEVKDLENHVKDIIFQFDIFIDSLSAIGRAYKFKKSKFDLKKSTTYLKAVRNKFVQKSSEFKLKIIRNANEKDKFILHIKDVIHIFIHEAYALRVSVICKKFKELEENDSIHNNR